jgi:hypothetical protein
MSKAAMPPVATFGADTTNGRTYFQYGGAWHYVNEDSQLRGARS